jgi:DNA-directed RNA polymerase specialized sigma24 family protein
MSNRVVEGVEREDFERFEVFLTAHYKRSSEESHRLLRAEIERRLRSKNTNPHYRPLLISNVEDLTSIVALRFIKICRILEQNGGVKNFDALLGNRVNHVYMEERRRIARQAKAIQLDDPETPDLAEETMIGELEEREERELEMRCYRECLRKLPERSRDIIIRYCEGENLTSKQREEKHRTQALELAKIPPEEATEEQITRAKNNLESRVSKLRSNCLQPWKETYMKRMRSRR